jgi:hypothetical protein
MQKIMQYAWSQHCSLKAQEDFMKENDKKTKRPDKTLQDDWIPDLERKPGATSNEMPEFGGDIKRKDSIEKGPTTTPPEYWSK